MKKTFFFLLIITVMLLSACQGQQAKQGGQSEQQTNMQDKAPIKIGFIGSLTGPGAALGEAGRIGATIAIDEINAAGGVDGRKLVMVQRDDETNPTKGLNVIKELIDVEKVDFILGPTHSNVGFAVRDYPNERKVIHFSLNSSTTITDAKKYPYLFKTQYSDDQIVNIMTDYLVNTRGLKKIALISASDAWGEAGKKDTLNRLQKYQMEPLVQASFNPGDIDMTGLVAKVQKANPEAAIVFAFPNEAAQITLAMRKMNYKLPQAGTGGFTMASFRDLIGGKVEEEILTPWREKFTLTEGVTPPAKLKEFADKTDQVRGSGRVPQTLNVVSAFDAVQIMADTVKKTGGTESGKLKQAIEGIKDYQWFGASYTFTPDQHAGMSADSLVPVRLSDSIPPGYFYKKLK